MTESDPQQTTVSPWDSLETPTRLLSSIAWRSELARGQGLRGWMSAQLHHFDPEKFGVAVTIQPNDEADDPAAPPKIVRESKAPAREPVTVGLYEAPSYHHAIAAVDKINEILTPVQRWDPEREAEELRLWTEDPWDEEGDGYDEGHEDEYEDEEGDDDDGPLDLSMMGHVLERMAKVFKDERKDPAPQDPSEARVDPFSPYPFVVPQLERDQIADHIERIAQAIRQGASSANGKALFSFVLGSDTTVPVTYASLDEAIDVFEAVCASSADPEPPKLAFPLKLDLLVALAEAKPELAITRHYAPTTAEGK
jgi:hypothetical protein